MNPVALLSHFLFNSKSKIGLFIIGCLYALFYNYIYFAYVVNYFGYMTGETNVLTASKTFYFATICGLPFIFYIGAKTIASVMSLFTYIFIYIPVQEALWCTPGFGRDFSISYSLLLLLCMSFFFLTDKLCFLKKAFSPKIRITKLSFSIIEVITIVIAFYLLYELRGQMSFVNFLEDSKELYEARAEQNFSTFVAYLVCWEKNAFIPLCLVYSLYRKERVKSVIAILLSFLIFMMDHQKMTFFMPLVICGLYFLFINKEKYIYYFHSGLIIILSILSYALFLLAPSPSSPVFGLAAILIMRTQTVSTWLSSMYFRFFETHPVTHYGHIGIVNALFHNYPYEGPLGRVVVDDAMNANANFILTDGYAADKAVGIVIVSFIFVFLKSLLNSIGERYETGACILIFIPPIMAMLNVSLFTAFFSYGFFILYLMFFFTNMKSLRRDAC